MGDSDAPFDPYYKWLAIPPAEQPPNHYRLLGVQRFESDSDVIATAADRQMAHVKSFATGPFSSDSQALLDELAQARICLLNPTAKQAYDTGLRQAESGATSKTRITSLPGIGAASAGADAPNPPTIRVAGQRTESIASGITGRRRRERKHATIRITGHIVFSLIGLSVAYVLLAKIGPQYDFLHLFDHAESNRAANGDDHAPPAPDATQSDAGTTASPPFGSPAQKLNAEDAANAAAILSFSDAQTTGESTTTSRRAPPSTSPDAWDGTSGDALGDAPGDALGDAPGDAPGDALGDALGDNVASPRDSEVLPFDEWPEAIDLPTIDEREIELGQVAAAGESRLSLRIVPPDNPLPAAQRFFTEATTTAAVGGDQWVVYYANEEARAAHEAGTQPLPEIAAFNFHEGRLSFEWRDRAAEVPWQKLRNSLLELSLRGATHLLQLRRAIVADPVRIVDRDDVRAQQKPYEIRVDVRFQPRPSNLYLEVTRRDGFPPMQPHAGDPKQLPASTKVETNDAIWNFTGVKYAGLVIRWERTGKSRIVIHVAPGYQLESEGAARIMLSSSDLDRRLQIGQKNVSDAREEKSRREQNRPNLNQKVNQARIARKPPRMAVTDWQPLQRKAINDAQTAIRDNENRIRILNAHIPKMERDLGQRIPRLKTIAGQIEGKAVVGFRLYTMAEGRKVILFETTDSPGSLTKE